MRLGWEQGMGLLLVAASAAYAWQAAQIPVPWMFSDPLGPRALPLALSLATGLLGGLLVIQSLRREQSAPRRPQEGGAAQAAPRVTETPGRLLAFVVALIAYVFLLSRLGFVPATFLFLLFAFAYLGERRRPRLMTLAVAFTLAFYLVFGPLLGVPLPRTPGF